MTSLRSPGDRELRARVVGVRHETHDKAQPGGAMTPRLVAGSFDERIVTLSAPSGTFVLPEVIPERLLLVTGGSGSPQ